MKRASPRYFNEGPWQRLRRLYWFMSSNISCPLVYRAKLNHKGANNIWHFQHRYNPYYYKVTSIRKDRRLIWFFWSFDIMLYCFLITRTELNYINFTSFYSCGLVSETTNIVIQPTNIPKNIPYLMEIKILI